MEIEVLKGKIDYWLKDYFMQKGTYNKIAYDAMSYSLNIGGKRIRPILLLLTYGLFNKNYENVMPMAGAIEMIHTYSLIHDDLPCMDDDDLRRGSPTNHKVFGEAMAVLAGDGLLNEAFNVMFKYCEDKDNNAIKACRVLSNAAGVEGMIGGQVVDILSEGKNITSYELEYMHKNKTGALIKAAVVCGAILAGAEEKEVGIISEYGDKLGMAFQIKDDILDVVGDTKTLGKKVKSDENNNKTNCITYYGLEESIKMCDKITNECMQLIDSIENSDTSQLKKLTMFLLKREY